MWVFLKECGLGLLLCILVAQLSKNSFPLSQLWEGNKVEKIIFGLSAKLRISDDDNMKDDDINHDNMKDNDINDDNVKDANINEDNVKDANINDDENKNYSGSGRSGLLSGDGGGRDIVLDIVLV